jgi:hypothetical protein
MNSSEIFTSVHTNAASRKPVRLRLAAGFGSMGIASMACLALLVAITVPLYAQFGLPFGWETLVPHVLLLGMLVGLWAHFRLVPDTVQGAFLIHVLLAVCLMLFVISVACCSSSGRTPVRKALNDNR